MALFLLRGIELLLESQALAPEQVKPHHRRALAVVRRLVGDERFRAVSDYLRGSVSDQDYRTATLEVLQLARARDRKVL